MSLKARLQALESKLSVEPTFFLTMPDGRKVTVGVGGHYALKLLPAGIDQAAGGKLSPRLQRELELIRDCVEIRDGSGGHMGELLKAMLHTTYSPLKRENTHER